MRQNQKASVAWLALWGLAVLLGAAGAAYAKEPPASPEPGSIETEGAETASSGRPEEARDEERPRDSALVSGQRAFIDPETKVLVVPSLKDRQESHRELGGAFSTSHDGLRPVALPNGFTYVDLQGRFLNATMATVEEDGTVKIHHAVPAPGETAPAEAEQASTGAKDRP